MTLLQRLRLLMLMLAGGVLAAWCLAVSSHVAYAEMPPLDPDIVITEEDLASGYLPDNAPAPSIHDANEPMTLMAAGGLPERYDGRELGYVTPVKNQNPLATCWAFATVGALESSLLAQGKAVAPDLSERHLVYFTYNPAPDPLGNTAGDETGPTGDNYLMRGANYQLAAHTLESWMGAADETAVPTYDELVRAYRAEPNPQESSFLQQVALSEDTSHELDSYHVTNVRRISMEDTDAIKQAIMEQGAVGISIKFSSACYRSATGAYYNASTLSGAAHTVEVVGWDDTYAVENFEGTRQGNVPAHPGAWIAKNSYGAANSYAAAGGYLYISYEEAMLNTESAKAYVFEAEPVGSLDNIYQYDGTAGTCTNSVSSGGSIANVFEVRANPSGEERLEAVSFSVSDSNIFYQVQVYTNITDSHDPTSGHAAYSTPVSGATTHAGYYTVNLPEDKQVGLVEDTKFSVVITLVHAGDNSDVKYDVDCTYGAGSTTGRYASSTTWYYCNAHVEPGQSFEQDVAGGAWDDLSSTVYDAPDEPACSARIKAFTTNVAIEPTDDIAQAQVEPIADQRYTSEELTPAPTITDGATLLVEGRHYRLAYRDNSEVGTATVTIEGIGRYFGERTVTFQIVGNPAWTRLWGNTALDTMSSILRADDVFTPDSTDVAIVASANGYKDALAATGLAGRLGAPVLITPRGFLSKQTERELKRLNPQRVIVVGGPVAVSNEVLTTIYTALPSADVYRVYGQNAVETSVALWRAGSGWGETAIIATSDSYKDALSIAPYAYAKGAPIFLANTSKDTTKRVISDEVRDAVLRGGFTRVVIVGGTSAVSGTVDHSLAAFMQSWGVSDFEVVRLPGANALDTSRLIGLFELSEGMTLTHLTVATNSSYKDALCGASLAGAQNSILVLASPQDGYTAFDALFDRNKVVHGHVLGGPVALSGASYDYFSTR